MRSKPLDSPVGVPRIPFMAADATWRRESIPARSQGHRMDQSVVPGTYSERACMVVEFCGCGIPARLPAPSLLTSGSEL